jgi:uncharacterized protein YhhL (DUF1145 family)
LNHLFKAVLLATYALAAISLFGLFPDDLGHLLQRIAAIVLVVHVVELALVFRTVRQYPGPLATSVVLTLLFGALHWKPLDNARRRQARD